MTSTRVEAEGLRRVLLVVAMAVLLVMTAAIGVQGYARMSKKLRTHSEATVNDLGRWTVLVPAFLHQHADYVDDGFPYPPVVLAVFAPLTLVSQPAAQLVWALCKFGLVVWIFVLVQRIVRDAGGRLDPLPLGLLLLVWLWPIVGDVQEGQTNLVMLLPLVMGLRFLQAGRTRADVAAGLLLALAASIKVTPVIFLVYVVLQRRWLVAGTFLAGMVLWLLLAPALLFGWTQNLTWLGQWARIMILPYVQHGEIHYYTGQSLASFMARTLQHVPAFTVKDGSAEPGRFVNVVDLPAGVVRGLTRGVLLAVLAAGAWWMRRPLETFRTPRFVVQIGCVAAFMLWASERTWIHHYVTLVLPLAALGMGLSGAVGPKVARWGRGALVFAAAAMLLTSDVARVFGPRGGDYVRALGVPLLASVLVVAAGVWAERRRAIWVP